MKRGTINRWCLWLFALCSPWAAYADIPAPTADNGTVSDAFAGERHTLTVTPVTGYHFDHWSDGCLRNPRYVQDGDQTTYHAVCVSDMTNGDARFYARQLDTALHVISGIKAGNLSWKYVGNDTGKGAHYTLTATPNTEAGYAFDHWKNNGVLLSEKATTYDIWIPYTTASVTYDALFWGQPHFYNNNQESDKDGNTVTLDSPESNCLNERYTLSATANREKYYFFAGWYDEEGHLLSVRNSWSFVPKGETCRYVAHFAQEQQTFLFENGWLDPTYGTLSADSLLSNDGTIVMTFTPASDSWSITKWSDATTTETEHTLHIDPAVSEITYSVTLGPKPVTLDVTIDNPTCGGMVTHATDICNRTQTLSASAAQYYTFAGWYDEAGHFLSARNPYVFTALDWSDGEERDIVAHFDHIPCVYWFDPLSNSDKVHVQNDLMPFTDADGQITLCAYPQETLDLGKWLPLGSQEGSAGTETCQTYTLVETMDDVVYCGARFDSKKYAHDVVLTLAEDEDITMGQIIWDNEDSYSPCSHVYTFRADAMPGYDFVGWYTPEGKLIHPRNPYKMDLADLAQPLIVHAGFRVLSTYAGIPGSSIAGAITAESTKDENCNPIFTLTANTVEAIDFTFDGWSDGVTDATREYNPLAGGLVEEGGVRAIWKHKLYAFEATVNDGDAEGCTITCNTPDICTFPERYEVKAEAGAGYFFTGWSDGVVNNPRYYDLRRKDTGATATALFTKNNDSTFIALNMPKQEGEVEYKDAGGDCSSRIYNLTAVPAPGYEFLYWEDDNTNTNPERTQQVRGVYTSMTGVFRKIPHGFNITKDDEMQVEELGNVFSPLFKFYVPTPEGMRFDSWNDGSTQNPRMIYPTTTSTYSAKFSFAGCRSMITYNDNPCGGTVSVQLNPATPCQCNYLVTPVPPEGYAFAGWTDNGTFINPRTISLEAAVMQSFTAAFVSDDNKFLTWYDNRLDIVTESLDMTDYDMTVYVGGEKVTPTPALTTNEQGLFTLPLGDIAGNAKAGSKLLVILSTKAEPHEIYSGMEVTIPLIFADKNTPAKWSDLAAVIPANMDETGVVVRDSAILTFNGEEPITIGPLEVIEDAKAVINAPLTVTSITMRGNGPKDKFPQLVANSNITNLNHDTVWYDYWLDYNAYYPLAMPNTVLCKDIRTRIGDTPYFEAQWYDGAQRATGAHSWKVYDDAQEGAQFGASEGFIIFGVGNDWQGGDKQPMQDTAYIRMPMHYDLTGGELIGKSMTVHAYDGVTGETKRDNDRNWNLIGIPYLANLVGMNEPKDDDTDTQILQVGQLIKHTNDQGAWTGGWDWINNTRYITIQKNGYQDYEQVKITEATLRPFNSYFIQAAGEGELMFGIGRKITTAPTRMSAKEKQEYDFDLTLSASGKADRTGLLIGDAFSTRYEFNADLAKMSGSTQPITLYTLMEGQPLAFCAIDKETAKQAIPLGFATRQGGEHTFALRDREAAAEQFELIALIDHEAGTATNLLEGDYTFTLSGKTSSDTRFAINAYVRQQKDNPTDLSGSLWQEGKVTGSTEEAGFGSLTPGLYTLTGQRIADLHGTATNIPAGVYLIVTEDGIRKEVLR